MRIDTLRTRVVTWYVGLLAAALLVFGATLYFAVQEYLRTSLQRTLVSEAGAIASTFLSQVESKGSAWMAGEINEAYDPELTGRFIRITRESGPILYQSADAREPLIRVRNISPVPDNLGPGPSFRRSPQPEGGPLLIQAQTYVSASGTHYWIETGASLAPIQRILSGLLRIVVLLVPLILIAAAFGGPMLMRVPLQPLVILAERAEQIGISALGERLPVLATGDEMERLALSLNRMITRLEDALSNNRRFSADVSHELRTPLTIMRGELEQVLLEPEIHNSTRASVHTALDEISRMAKIVESLLTISRLNAGADAIYPQPVDLTSICEWTVDQMRLLAEEKGISIEIAAHPLPVCAEPARLKQVFVNLIDNAIKYTPEGGRVIVTSSRTDRLAIIEIADSGIGISPDDLLLVFQRFFRADKGRARSSGGTGLGLSIVKAICTAHGGDITLHSREGEGTVARVELPLDLSQASQAPQCGHHESLDVEHTFHSN